MKIRQIQQYFSSVKTNTAKNRPIPYPMQTVPTAYDTFEVQNSKETTITKKVLSKIHKFKIKDYKTLSANELNALRTVCNGEERTRMAAEKSIKMALILKPYLDKKYGKDKYVFVSIGRSPVGIARVFEFMGAETKYLPISGLRDYPDVYCAIGASNGLKEYGNFLNKQGISNQNISNSDKQYLFFDYTYKGKSLQFYSQLIREYYGINQKNMHFLSIWDTLKNAEKDNPALLREIAEYVTIYLTKSGIQDFGGISELKVDKLTDIKTCKKYESEKAKKFNFLVIDTLSEKGLLKENPNNRKSL